MNKRIISILIVIVLLILAGISIYYGIVINNNSKPINIYSKVIDNISNRIKDISEINSNYKLGDSFTVNGEIDLDLKSEYYEKNSLTDIDYLKKNNLLKRLSNMDIKYSLIQDAKKDKLFMSLDEKINENEILSGKYLIDNSTKYYFVNNIVENYVNGGSCNYFEALDETNTTETNINYLYDLIIESLKNNLKEEYFYTNQVDENINNNTTRVNEVSLKLDNKRIREILKGILKDIQKDEKANLILDSFIKDFNKVKLDESKKYLDNNESITISIYLNKLHYKPLKYKIIYMNETNRNIFQIENNKIMYLENNMIKYTGEIIDKGNNISIDVMDNQDNKIGNIKYEKGEQNTTLSVSLNLEKSNYDIEYSSKYTDVKKKKSYTNEKSITFKVMDELTNKINGSIKIVSNIEKGAKIEETRQDAVLESTLKPEQKEKIDKLYDNIKNRLES